MDAYWREILTTAGIMSVSAMGLWVIKKTGQLSAGHAGFMGLGGYASGVITGKLGLPVVFGFAGAILLVAIVSTLFAMVTSRLRFFYQAIGTLAFGETLVLVAYNTEYVGGASGLHPIPQATSFWLVLAVMAVCIYFFSRFENSRLGQAFHAVWEDDTAAEAVGIDADRIRIMSFALGSTVAAVGGVLYAHFLGIIEPSDLNFLKSMFLLMFVAFGGLETFWGAIFGTFILSVVPEFARFSTYDRYIIWGAVIVATMAVRPKGLLTRKPLGAPDGIIMRTVKGMLRPVTERFVPRQVQTQPIANTEEL